nr:ATP synthase CF0 B' subunit [Cryptomonas borealis]
MINLLFSFTLQAASTESKGGLFDFNATLPVMALQVCLLMWILNVLFYTPIGKILNEREESIRNKLSQSSELLMKAENITKQYELELNQKRREAQTIIAHAQKGAQELIAMELKQAQKDTELLIESATNQLALQKEKALQVLEEQIITLSELIRNKLLSKQLIS